MIDALAYGLLGAGLILAGWAGVLAARQRPTGEAIMIAAIVVQVGLVVQTALGLIRLSGVQLVEPVTFVAYAIGILAPLPLGFQLARIERTRWGSGALAFTAVVAAVMTLRLLQLWRAR